MLGQKAVDQIVEHMSAEKSRCSFMIQHDPTLDQWTVVYSHGQVDDPDTPTTTHASIQADLAAALGQVSSELS